MASSYTEYFQLNQWAAEAEGKADRAQLTELSARVERAEQAAEENRTALEAAEQAWRDQTSLHLLKTATLSTGGDSFQFSLAGVDWPLWRLVHLVIEPKVKDQQGVSLYLDGGKQLLSLVGYGKTHIVLYPWHSGDWPFQGWAVSGGWSHFEDPRYFSSATGLTLTKSFPDYPLLAGCKITMYGEK